MKRAESGRTPHIGHRVRPGPLSFIFYLLSLARSRAWACHKNRPCPIYSHNEPDVSDGVLAFRHSRTTFAYQRHKVGHPVSKALAQVVDLLEEVVEDDRPICGVWEECAGLEAVDLSCDGPCAPPPKRIGMVQSLVVAYAA